MCGIAYRKYWTIKNVLGTQEQRGLDGVGLLYEDENKNFKIHKYFVDGLNSWLEKTTDLPTAQSYTFPGVTYTALQKVDLYQDIIEHQPNLDKEKYVFMHHRKWSVGALSLNNTHPFKWEKFILAQNGTCHSIKEWGIVEWVPMENTDTHSLLHYIEKYCTSLQDIIDKLEVLCLRGVSIGVACIYSIQEKQMLFFSDAARSLYVKFNDDTKTTIDYIQSLKDDSELTDSFETKGYIIVDMEGNVIKERLIDLNKKKITYTAPAKSSYYGTRYNSTTTSHVQDFDFDDYYDNLPWQTSIIDHFGSKKKEDTEKEKSKEDSDKEPRWNYIPSKQDIEEIFNYYKDLDKNNPNVSPYEIIEDFTTVKNRWSFLIMDIWMHRTKDEKTQTNFCYNTMQLIKSFAQLALNLYIEDLNEMHADDPTEYPAEQLIEEVESIKKSYQETINFKLIQ